MNEIRNLYPQSVWQQFDDICAIPHPSHHEDMLRDHIVAFCIERSLDHEVDAIGNIIIRKPATAGMEDRRGVILQAHMDMVPEKNSDKEHDFTKDPIEPVIDGEWVRANNTTLGADNGIGLAAAMAVLAADDVPHGPLEVLVTTNEEDGMSGAQGLKPGLFKGDIFLNLDTEEEGEVYVGCAGGVRIVSKGTYAKEAVPAGHALRAINIKGLNGGHSGCDIHLYRANAIKLMVRTVKALEVFGARLVNLQGGKLFNAIPREADAVIALPEDKLAEAEAKLDSFAAELCNEYQAVDAGLTLSVAAVESADSVLSLADQRKWLDALHVCPNGVIRMSDAIEGVVETSANLGVAKIENGEIQVQVLPRSLVDSACDDTRDSVKGLFTLAGAEVSFHDGYPGWQPIANSAVQQLVQDVYRKLFNKDAQFKVIHAGLECGTLGKKYPNWDMASFGPTIKFPHSPAEKTEITSVGHFWQLMLAVLAETPVA
ncbi:aminoacyl-histidine dipeptidase [Sansalvadorimonas sp. 2012CJ34-2]|uniref:Aminoacyl-histidine dipeptidase n=1 Tax=Parendozoicomonas callyspongiae TaxID=2942213 RepID=A0ABT0PF24_9GAMM|nr:aminoacyl-histidine dipeptidase [Sansalvadorimonas sp. 2012CJ34-2]MCL6269606.1 aminoacyl-histidine dipeptidase [Sansalvadorimonas sp. 2012CJ34-2]